MYDGRVIGVRVKELREAHNWTMRQLAERVGVGHGHISQLEGGKIPNPSVDFIARLADAFGLPVDELVGRDDEIGDRITVYEPIASDPTLRGIQVNLKKLSELSPDDIAAVDRVVRSMLKEAEEQEKERRRAERKRAGSEPPG